ncbi:superoxide dismutase family protein [Bacillus sp. FSL K6-3431]|uniref:superoxide dismutase family protein n=1 Tax=Bacillus sp. FSL K6-3431 TaxID=2921500 RepID=UPI004046FE4E
MKKVMLFVIVAMFTLIVGACATDKDATPQQNKDEAVPVSSSTPLDIDIINTKDAKVGKATLTETKEGVKIGLKIEGMEPGTKAIHIHETAKCDPPDFKSAGEHFNPGHKEHGFDNPKGFHSGDLPNIEVSDNGTVNVEIIATNVTLGQGENSLLDEDGSALVIHENADDYKTDPAGNSGDRIACGAITK